MFRRPVPVSQADRSLSVKIDAAACDGFIVHSFAGETLLHVAIMYDTQSGSPNRHAGAIDPCRAAHGKIPSSLTMRRRTSRLLCVFGPRHAIRMEPS